MVCGVCRATCSWRSGRKGGSRTGFLSCALRRRQDAVDEGDRGAAQRINFGIRCGCFEPCGPPAFTLRRLLPSASSGRRRMGLAALEMPEPVTLRGCSPVPQGDVRMQSTRGIGEQPHETDSAGIKRFCFKSGGSPACTLRRLHPEISSGRRRKARQMPCTTATLAGRFPRVSPAAQRRATGELTGRV